MPKKTKEIRFNVSIHFSITTIFVILLTVISLAIVLVSYHRYNKFIENQAALLIKQSSLYAEETLKDYLEPLTMQTKLTKDFIEHGVINPNNKEDFIDYSRELMEATPHLFSVYYAYPNGDFLGVNHRKEELFYILDIQRSEDTVTAQAYFTNREDKKIGEDIKIETVYDPRIRPWYLKALAQKKVIWSDLYQFSGVLPGGIATAGLTSAVPIFDAQGEPLGVFAIDINLLELKKFIQDLNVSENGVVVILDSKGNIIAGPQSVIDTKELKKRSVFQLPQVWIKDSYKKYLEGNSGFFVFKSQGEGYYSYYETIDSIVGEPWVISVVVPSDDFMREVKKVNFIIAISYLVLIIIGLFLVYRIAHQISRPIRELVRHTKKVKDFELDEEVDIKSKITEIIDMQDAINTMKDGLKNFKRYVPADLVRKLIVSGNISKVGGKRKPLTILFTDIYNFTNLSEDMEPEVLMERLSEYFTDLNKIIDIYQGTIDKYIGDSIMAFWGAPAADEKHAIHACKAALTIKHHLNDSPHYWDENKTKPVITRIGINTSEVIVGNVGSEVRLNYTAIGDGVNLASRLEGLNKYYGTLIIVNETTYEETKERFYYRRLDYVSVKGKNVGCYIYELVAEEEQDLPEGFEELNKLYTNAFVQYQERNWRKSMEILERLIEKFPADQPAKVLYKRCEMFLIDPPGDDWNGIWSMEAK